ncbi:MULTISPECIES: hypothetical protein [Roseobacteraceae]|uniref:hypothetical protein n=1 Tax=Roseobacteraceae TaxID=2854170 RepID=UPI0011BF57D8|nr:MULTISPECIES: hypothetical protein [Roseobacteraceae]MBT8167491.1 hypothetical protein [Falsiruegeria litorea]
MSTKSRSLIGLFAVSAMFFTAADAHAQQSCGLRTETLDKLEKQYDERVYGRGLTPNGKSMFELLISETGSWTVLASTPEGHSCVVAGGDSWHEIGSLAGNPT